MARNLIHIDIFVASPGDVNEERDVVASVVQELNTLFRTTMGVCLDLIRWETHAYPSIGVDAQDIINKQINDEYDIFIGLMWKRFGTETGRAGSGSEEEFDRAYQKHKVDNGQTKVMMYFSDKKFSMNEIDFEQLAKVQSFKKKTENLGVLHWTYTDSENLQQLLRLQIPRHVKDILSEIKKSSTPGVNNDIGVDLVLPENDSKHEGGDAHKDDWGYIDFVENFTIKMGSITKVMHDMRLDTEELGERINAKTSKLAALNKAKSFAPEEHKRLYGQVADASINYARKNEKNIDNFHDLYIDAISSLSDAIAIQRQYTTKESIEEMKGLINEIIESQLTINGLANNTKELRYQIKSMPSISKMLNKAYRVLDGSLGKSIKEFNGYHSLLGQLVIVLQEIVDDFNADDESSVEVIA